MPAERPVFGEPQEQNRSQSILVSKDRVETWELFAGALRFVGYDVRLDLPSKTNKMNTREVLTNTGKLVYELYGKPKALEAFNACVGEYERVRERFSSAAGRVEKAHLSLVLAGHTIKMLNDIRKGHIPSLYQGDDFRF